MIQEIFLHPSPMMLCAPSNVWGDVSKYGHWACIADIFAVREVDQLHA